MIRAHRWGFRVFCLFLNYHISYIFELGAVYVRLRVAPADQRGWLRVAVYPISTIYYSCNHQMPGDLESSSDE